MGTKFDVTQLLKVQREYSLRQSYHNPDINGNADPLDREPDKDEDEDEEDLERWVIIQKEAFTNWCNDKLKTKDIVIKDIKYDFRDGVTLCKLMEILRGKKLKGKLISKSRLNWVTANGNIALAMDAMKEDGISLVNIGPEDVVGGNSKLILGMIWLLIRRYQIGSQTKVPPKKLMLAWINAILSPYLTVNNFASDWNDGKALHGVIEYCRPGTCGEWWRLDRYQKLDNCKAALDMAFEHFQIPHIITAKHLASNDMEELSGMTYMSYFMTVGACGYNATLEWLQKTISPIPVTNFDTDWNDGLVASALVTVLGGEVGWPKIDTKDNLTTCKKAIEISSREFRLPVEKFITGKDMTNKEVDHIEIMAYAAWHRNGPETRITIHRPVGVVVKEPQVVPVAPERVIPETVPIPVMAPVPRITSVQRLSSIEESEPDEDTGRTVRFAPRPPSPPTPPLLEEEPEPEVTLELLCKDVVPLWHVVSSEVHVYKTDPSIKSRANDLTGLFTAPSGATMDAEIFLLTDGKFNITFQPDETGTWFLDMFHKGEKTRDLPWRILVIDPKAAKVQKHFPDTVQPDRKYIFKIDMSDLNHDAVDVSVEYQGQLVPYQVTQHLTNIDSQIVNFVPKSDGVYTVAVKCLEIHITGSPFEVRVSSLSSPEVTPTVAPTLSRSMSNSPIFATGKGLREGVQTMQATFRVDVSKEPGKKLEVEIKDPLGVNVKSVIADSDTVDGDVIEHSVYYTPEEYGKHKIRVLYDNQEIADSPFFADIKQPMIYIRDLQPVATLGQKHRFYVDTSAAGKGTVMMDSDLPVVTYDKVEQGKYLVEVMPKKVGRHDLTVMYDNKQIEGSPFMVDVVRPEKPPKGFMKGPRTTLTDSQLLRDAFEY